MIRSLVCAALSLVYGYAQPKPDPAELKYAVVVSRHGVRSPTWSPERLNQYSSSPWPDWGVPPGYLTTHGRQLMKIMGSYYREYFTSHKLLGKANCGDVNRTFLWADTDQRTMETARALAEGMLPACKAQVRSAREGSDDPLFDPISAGVAVPDPKLAVAAVKGRVGPNFDAAIEARRPAFDELVRVLNGNGRAAKSIFDQPPSLTADEGGAQMSGPLALASTLTEDFLLEYTNGMSGSQLGWGRLNASNLLQIMTLHTAYADLMRRTPYLARVRGSNLLSRIVRSLEQGASGKPVKGAVGPPATALLVLSGHDTNISNLSGLLDLSWTLPSYQPDDAPPGGALVFTLWHDRDSGRYSVRLNFIAQTLDQMHDAAPLTLAHPPASADVFIPGCSTASEGWSCDLPLFRASALAALDGAFVQ